MSHRSHHREDHADDEDDDADGPQDRDVEEKTGDEENDSENDHRYLPDSLLVGVTISGSVLEDVFGFGPCLLGVSLGLLDASLGAQPGVAGGAAEVLLGGALNGFGLMGELLADAHVGFLRVVAIANRPRPGIDRSSVSPPTRVRRYQVVSRSACRHCSALRRSVITATAKQLI